MTINLRESEVQERGVELLRKLGAQVYVTSQHRASSVTKGVPDVLAFPPGRPHFFWEAKSASGKQSPEQAEFQRHCEAASPRVAYVLGGTDALWAHLTQIGLLCKGAA